MRSSRPLFAVVTHSRKPFLYEEGQHVYAFCHVKTKQVLYSLDRSLHGHHSLKQLPDTGANTPQATATLRRDEWRPLFSVSFPFDPSGPAQGVHAYQKLLEWRRLHEHYWTPPPELSQPYTEEEKETVMENYRKRGGSKKENVYDIITRQKKKIRRQEVMNQKANAVADLAAVLKEQGELGNPRGERQALLRKNDRAMEVKEMLELTIATSKGRLADVGKRIDALQPFIERREGWRKEDGAKTSQREARRKLYHREKKQRRMEFASAAVAEAQRHYRSLKRRRRRLAELEAEAEKNHSLSEDAETKQYLSEVCQGMQKARSTLLADDASIDALEDFLRQQKEKASQSTANLPDSQIEHISLDDFATLQDRLNGFEAAVNPSQIPSILGDDLSSATESEENSLTLPQVLESVDAELQASRKSGGISTWLSRKTTISEEQVARLERKRAVCERIMPAFEDAKKAMQENGGEAVVREWIADIRARADYAELEASMSMAPPVSAGVLEGYQRVLRALEELDKNGEPPAEPINEAQDQQNNAVDARGAPMESASVAKEWLSNLAKEQNRITERFRQLEEKIRQRKEELRALGKFHNTVTQMKGSSASPSDSESFARQLEADLINTWCSIWVYALGQRRNALRRIPEAELSEGQQAQLKTLNESLVGMPKQRKSAKEGTGSLLERLSQDRETVTQVLEGIDTASETRSRRLRNEKAQIDILRQALAKTKGVEVDEVFPEIQIPEAINESANVALEADLEKFQKMQQRTLQENIAAEIDYINIGPVDFYSRLPSFPPEEPPAEGLLRKVDAIRAQNAYEKRNETVFSLEGVRIKWNNVLDAEYAEEWPAELADDAHQPMSLTSYRMPKPEDEAVLGVQELREKRHVEENKLRDERRQFVGGMKKAIVQAVKERVEQVPKEERRPGRGKKAEKRVFRVSQPSSEPRLVYEPLEEQVQEEKLRMEKPDRRRAWFDV